ncbi:glutathione S-transferase family protein [Candidatus Uabimicrobium sp. HlEnr_7]|uniref:glutathione S-transferase family protein n=1 Tax=Candidatus Uabimicrobium helgolandensis TaxID=3095367 RepID=UPI0035571FF6
MIKLYQFSKTVNKPDPSPFCIKCEIFMKVHDIEHECRLGDVRKAPKQKLPYIKDGETLVCDSETIIKYLSDKQSIDMDKNLSAEQKAVSYSMCKMMEEHFYFLLVYARWIDEEGWKDTKQTFQKSLPAMLRPIIPKLVRGGLKKTLHGQGTGRHSHQEIVAKVNEVFQNLNDFLGEKTYLMGEEITSVDISVFAFITGVANYPSFATQELKKYNALANYEKRIAEKYYSQGS